MLRKIFATGIALSSMIIVNAQDVAVTSQATETPAATTPPAEKPEEKKSNFVFSGFADVYYKFDFGRHASNNRTSFTNSHNSFELGMASVKLEHSIGKISMVADLGFGKRAEEFSYNDANTRFAVKQLFVSYSPWKNFKLTAGSWATHVGYELVDPYGNRNYSMSYLFSYGPFAHTGIKAETTIGKNGFMLGIANPTDFKSTTLEHKYVIGQYSTASSNDKFKAYFNFLAGKPNDSTKNSQFDVVLTAALSSTFSIGLNGSVANFKAREADGKYGSNDSWYGTALYLNADPKPWLGITLRTEYFNDKKQLNVFNPSISPKGGNVFANTLSANFKIDNLTIIPEFRMDNASEEIFVKSNGTATKTAGNFLVAAIYKF
jgi:hypothetical protein